MSGIRFYSFREGDRAEYLANYLLSGIGLVAPVLRQEDIGYDFYCSLADNEKGNITFDNQFLIQIKGNQSDIIYGDIINGKWHRENIDWVFKLKLPFLIGIVNKKEIQLDIYNTSPLWDIHRRYKECSKIILSPRFDLENKSDIGLPNMQKIKGSDYQKFGDGNQYIIDLGLPVVTLRNNDFDVKDKLKSIKDLLRKVLFIEQRNLYYKETNMPYFEWVHKIETNKNITKAWIHFDEETKENTDQEILENLSQPLIALTLHYKNFKKDDKLKMIKPLLSLLNENQIYKELRDKYPDLFGK